MKNDLKIRIIGCLGYTPWKTKLAKKFTSCRMFWDNKSIQIDIGNKYEGRTVDALLITHLHYDHIQEFQTCPTKTEVLVPSGSFIDKLRAKNDKVNFRLFKAKTSLDGLEAKPFPVLHSSTSLTYGFKFFYRNKTIVWLPDYCVIPMLSEIFSNVDVVFLGASALKKPIQHKGYGHCQASCYNILKKLSELKKPPKKIYLIHFGMGMSPIALKTRYLQKEFPKLSIYWTWDKRLITIDI